MKRSFFLLLAGVAAAVVACGSRPVDRDAEPLRITDEPAIVELDEERKAAMVSNLLVVLCGNKDAQPIVNSGSLY